MNNLRQFYRSYKWKLNCYKKYLNLRMVESEALLNPCYYLWNLIWVTNWLTFYLPYCGKFLRQLNFAILKGWYFATLNFRNFQWRICHLIFRDLLLRVTNVVFTRSRHIYLRQINISIVLMIMRYILLLWNALTSRKRISCKHGINFAIFVKSRKTRIIGATKITYNKVIN